MCSMKIMLINCVYGKGSTGKIVADLKDELDHEGFECLVCFGRGKRQREKGVIKTASEVVSKIYNFFSRFTGIQFGGQILATKHLIRIIRDFEPNVVNLHCINGFFVNVYSLLNYLKKNNIPTVLTLHAEFMYTGGCGYAVDCEQWRTETGCQSCPQLKEATGSYMLDRTSYCWKRMRDAFDSFERLVAVSVSPWLENRAKVSTILRDKKHQCILNGIDTGTIFKYYPESKLRNAYNLNSCRIALFVTASFTEFKGAKHLLTLCDRMPNTTFVVIGNNKSITEKKKNLLDIGRVENQHTLAEFYSVADVTLLLSKRETFSMVCAESLSCGTPVVGFKAGAPESICLSEYSLFCDYGDIETLISNINDVFQKTIDKYEISKAAQKVYSKSRMSKEYIHLYNSMVKQEDWNGKD